MTEWGAVVLSSVVVGLLAALLHNLIEVRRLRARVQIAVREHSLALLRLARADKRAKVAEQDHERIEAAARKFLARFER